MKRKHQFTLVELLIVIGIVVILAAMLFAGLGGASDKAEKAKAKAQIVDLKNAIAAFEMEYNKLPKPKGYSGGELSKDQYNWLIMTLAGVKPDNSSSAKDEEKKYYDLAKDKDGPKYGDLNTRHKQFMKPTKEENGILFFKDPWDISYKVIFENAYDEGISEAIDGLNPGKDDDGNEKVIRQSVIIWSTGPDKEPDGTSDDADARGRSDSHRNHEFNEDNVYSVDTSWTGKIGHAINE